MDDVISTRSTSLKTAISDDVVLVEGPVTRRVLRIEMVQEPSIPGTSIRATLLHQRKTKDDQWEDTKAINLTKLRAGDGVKLKLDGPETKKLYEELGQYYALHAQEGVQYGRKQFVSLPPDTTRREVLQRLLSQNYPSEVWDVLSDQNPRLILKLSYLRILREREQALQEFEQSISGSKEEGYWQHFFELNDWIFGYGLDYRFLRIEQVQPHIGSQDVAGRGNQKADFLMKTCAASSFTVLVEVKRPDTELLGVSQYRSGTWSLGSELVGGIVQLQTECSVWETVGAQQPRTAKRMRSSGIDTVRPKGILVIGRLSQLLDENTETAETKRRTFELFRRCLHGVEVVTFDELLERARFIVRHTRIQSGDKDEESDESIEGIPF